MLTTGDPGSGESCVCRVCRGRGGGGESAPELEGVRVPTSKNLCLKNWPVLSSIALYHMHQVQKNVKSDGGRRRLFESCFRTQLCAPGWGLDGDNAPILGEGTVTRHHPRLMHLYVY